MATESQLRRVIRLPLEWGEIPRKASRREEVEWVHQNYVLVVKRVKDKNKFYWRYASSPAPSYGAIRLMRRAALSPETWDREVFFKMRGDGEAEGEAGRRRGERQSIEEMERVLGRYLEGVAKS